MLNSIYQPVLNMKLNQRSLLVLLLVLAGYQLQAYYQAASQSEINKINQLIERVGAMASFSPDSVIVLTQQALELSQSTESHHRKAQLLFMLGKAYRDQSEYDQAIEYLNKSLLFSKDQGDLRTETLSLRNLGIAHFMKGEDSLALPYRMRALENFKKLKDSIGEAGMLIDLGNSYLVMGDFEKSTNHLLKAEEILLNQDRTEEVKRKFADVYDALAGNHGYQGNFPKTSENLLKARGLYEELGDSSRLANTLGQLGQVQMIQLNYPKALEYYMQSVAIDKSLPNSRFLHFTYRSMAELFENMNESDSAISYYRKSFFLSKELKAPYLVVFAGASLPRLYFDKGMYDSARYFSKEATALIDNIQDVQAQGFSWQNLGRYNLLKGDYALAEAQLLKAYDFGKNYSASVRMDVSGFLTEVYKAKGNHEQALKFLEINKEMRDSLFNEEQIRKVAELEAGFEHEKELLQKENEISMLTVKEELANLRLITGVICFSLLTLGLLYLFRRNIKRKEKEAKDLEEVNQFKETMTGMIAHDLKNPLSLVLNSNSENNKVKQAAGQMLQLVTNMLDVHKFEAAKVKVLKEDLNVSDLLYAVKTQVLHLLSQKNLNFNIMSEHGFSVSADKDLLERIMVNLLTNAIKYTPVNSTITAQVLACGEQFCFSVSDEGPGIPADQLSWVFDSFRQLQSRKSGGTASTGLGLTFCKLALEAHGSEIKVSSVVGQGTTFSFALESATGEVSPQLGEVSNPLILALKSIKKEDVAPQINKLQRMKLYEVGEIRRTLMEVKSEAKENQEAIELWINSVLNAAYQGNDQEYDRLVAVLA